MVLRQTAAIILMMTTLPSDTVPSTEEHGDGLAIITVMLTTLGSTTISGMTHGTILGVMAIGTDLMATGIQAGMIPIGATGTILTTQGGAILTTTVAGVAAGMTMAVATSASALQAPITMAAGAHVQVQAVPQWAEATSLAIEGQRPAPTAEAHAPMLARQGMDCASTLVILHPGLTTQMSLAQQLRGHRPHLIRAALVDRVAAASPVAVQEAVASQWVAVGNHQC